MTTIVANPNRRAVAEIPLDTAVQKFAIMSTTRTGDFRPIRGYICCKIMITPIPLIKPDKTG